MKMRQMATDNPLRVLYLTSEVSPLLKVGGLGDVAGALPKALRLLGVDISIVIPWSPRVKFVLQPWEETVGEFTLVHTFLPDSEVPVILLKHPSLLETTPAAYARIAMSIVELKENGQLPFDLFHGNDWFAASTIELLSRKSIPTLLTIHNLSYHPKLLQAAIQRATMLTTVSPTYADEIRTETRHDLIGILNGIDTDVWNPLTDLLIPTQYGVENWSVGKQKNKEALVNQLNLAEPTIPLLAFIGRLDTQQKGVNKIIEILPLLLAESNVVILGTGADELERVLQKLGQQNPEHLSVNLRFDEKLAHQIYASADMMLIPSSFEPCGLVQMISMRYGTIPVAHAVGGLKDTIRDHETGSLYQEDTSSALNTAIEEALKVYQSDRWATMVMTAMQEDFSWKKSAKAYQQLYASMMSYAAGRSE
ncbi:MAG: glycogen/starch synthase [bacterium]|nr:glycogen/starch synthase [bacterium]